MFGLATQPSSTAGSLLAAAVDSLAGSVDPLAVPVSPLTAPVDPFAGSAVALQVVIDPAWFVVAAVGLFLLAALVAPLVVQSMRDSRPPTAGESETLDSLLEPSGYKPAGIDVVDTVGENSIQVSVRGLPGRRRLLVTDYVLAELDGDTASALLAAEAERARHYYVEYRSLASAAVIGIATGMFGGLLSFSDGLFALAIAALVLFWLGRKLQFAADHAAAARVGSDKLADAFETVAAVRGVEPASAGWRTWVEVQPPLGQRIDRLRAAADA